MNAWASLTLHGFDGRELFTVYARDIHEMVENIRKLGYKCAIEGDDCIVVDVGEVIFPAYMDPIEVKVTV